MTLSNYIKTSVDLTIELLPTLIDTTLQKYANTIIHSKNPLNLYIQHQEEVHTSHSKRIKVTYITTNRTTMRNHQKMIN